LFFFRNTLNYRLLAFVFTYMLLIGNLSQTIVILSSNNWEEPVNSVDSFDNNTMERFPYIGKPLTYLKGLRLFNAELVDPAYYNYYQDLYDPMVNAFLELYNITYRYNCDCGRLIYSKTEHYVNKSFGLDFYDIKYEKCNMTITNKGYLLLIYGDGYVNNIYILNESDLEYLTEYLGKILINNTAPLGMVAVFDEANISVAIAYAGIGAESIETTISYIADNSTTNNTSYDYTVNLVNPYHKFYILFNDVRVAYPLKIGLDNVSGKPVLKYLEIYIPPISYPFIKTKTIINESETTIIYTAPDEEYMKQLINNYTFVIDDYYLQRIVDLFRVATNSTTATADDIIVADIYYLPTKNYSYITPVLELYENNSSPLHDVVVMRLYRSGPVVESVWVVSGTPSASDPINMLLYHLNTTREKKHEIEEFMKKLPLIGVAIAISLIVIALILILKAYLRRIYRK